MKKTLIALMALAGVAMADTGAEMNQELKGFITSTGYTFGDAYTLTFNIGDVASGDENNIYYLQLDDSYYLFSQQNSYMGLTDNTSNNPTSNWFTISSGGSTNTMSVDASSGNPTGFFTWSATGTKSQMPLGDNGGANDAGVCVTLSFDGKSTTTLTFAAPTVTDTLIISNLSLDANNFKFNEGRTYLVGSVESFTSTPASVPEPATATLSLLALAGLCARRRRA